MPVRGGPRTTSLIDDLTVSPINVPCGAYIWTILMLKILQAHLLRAFVANSIIDGIYALYPESFCNKNLAVRKVFAFSDSDDAEHEDDNDEV